MAYHEITIKIASQFKDALTDMLSQPDCLGMIEQRETLVAYFPETLEIGPIIDKLTVFQALLEKAGQVPAMTFEHALVPEQDWNESWKKGFHAIDIGERFTIRPPWEEKKEGRINLVVDPAMAFGTGHHETTRSCLLLMEKYADKNSEHTFLDLGTGTGILAIAASKLGYQRVVAVDTDPLAVDATQTNCALNGVTDIEVHEGSITALEETFDRIAANLISGVLVQLAPALSGHLKPDGIAYLSGILSGQEEEVIEAVKAAGLELIEKYPDGKWVSLVVKK